MMRFAVTYMTDMDVQKIFLCKTLEEARTFVRSMRKAKPNYKNFKIKVIKP